MATVQQKRKFVIDCDAGTDDAAAIIMALASKDVEVVAITCVVGNTHLDNVTTNVLKVLKLCNRLDIPVYRGCEKSLLGVGSQSSGYHGEDGLGDVRDVDQPKKELLQKQHAVFALLDLADKHSGEISLIALGPLTNIAMAIRLRGTFGKQLHKCFIMGGNTQGKGNISVTGEFNTFSDPEAALVVFNELSQDLYLLPLELCRQHARSWDEYDKLVSMPSKKAQQMKRWEEQVIQRQRDNLPGYRVYDQLAVAAAINDSFVEESCLLHGTVELHGTHTRGQMVWDWEGKTKQKPNIHLVTKVNGTLLKEMLTKAYED